MNKKMVMWFLAMFLFFAVVSLACAGGGDDFCRENPTVIQCTQPARPVCDNACGLTSPLNSVEQAISDTLAGDNAQNTLSGGNQ